jgi:hypothetical protein
MSNAKRDDLASRLAAAVQSRRAAVAGDDDSENEWSD